jgi:hypothetical protein
MRRHFDRLSSFDKLRMHGHFDRLSSFDKLRMHGHFDRLSANGGFLVSQIPAMSVEYSTD